MMDDCVRNILERYEVTAETREFLSRPAAFYIDGDWVEAGERDVLDIYEPSSEGRLGKVPVATSDDIDRAVAAARQAHSGAWGRMTPSDRERRLHRLADLIEAHAQTLAEIETIDNGKAIGPCLEVDILGSVELLRYMAGWPSKISGATRQVSFPSNSFAMTLKEPIGAVGAIVPWNWPFSMAMWKLCAPLAAGCSIVLKPAELTPFSILYFCKLCEEADLPPGTVNIVTGPGESVGAALVSHPDLAKVSFTGSTAVGRRVGAAAGRALSPVTLELGGKSPMIVFEDADLDAVVEATQASIFFNAGQVCSAGSRLYAQESVFEELVERVVARAETMTVAPGLDPTCDLGPLVSKTQRDRVLAWIEQGKSEGGVIRTGGHAMAGPGWFVEPTVMTLSDNRASIVQEEVFGPVLTMLSFKEPDEALSMANDNRYGLAASVWTKNINRALSAARDIQAGSIWINAHDLIDPAFPFGGVKESGFGKDLGPEQLDQYLITKTVWAHLGD